MPAAPPVHAANVFMPSVPRTATRASNSCTSRRWPTNAASAAKWNANAATMMPVAIATDCGARNVSLSSLPKRPTPVLGLGKRPSRTADFGVRDHSQIRHAMPPVKTANAT